MQYDQTQQVSQIYSSYAKARLLWIVLLIAGCTILTLKFACAAPFAALAALAALDMNRRDGVLLILGVWAANQAIGYGVLGYPHEFQSYAWGAVIGLASLAAFFAARFTAHRMTGHGIALAAPAALLAAFVATRIIFTAAEAILPGDFLSWQIVLEIARTNAVAFIVLLALHAIVAQLGLLPKLSERTAI